MPLLAADVTCFVAAGRKVGAGPADRPARLDINGG